MSTTTDTPETDAATYDVIYRGDMGCTITATDREQCDGGAHVDSDFARTLERRARAAEARVKELEKEVARFKANNRYQRGYADGEREARAAFRLRPIAEAGPVPDGMIRFYASRIPLGPPGAEFWSAFSETGEEDTDFIDVYPPQQ